MNTPQTVSAGDVASIPGIPVLVETLQQSSVKNYSQCLQFAFLLLHSCSLWVNCSAFWIGEQVVGMYVLAETKVNGKSNLHHKPSKTRY